MTIEDTPRFYKGSTTLIDDIIQPPIFWVQYLGHLVVLWTLLYGFVIFPNHPSPAMLECHDTSYWDYCEETEGCLVLVRDETCELDTQTMWGLAFLAGVASTVCTFLLGFVSSGVILVLYVIGAICYGCVARRGDVSVVYKRFCSKRFCSSSGTYKDDTGKLISMIYTIFAPPVVLWTLVYRFGIFPNHPSPAMLECHEEVYYNNQTEALEQDKTCELDTQTMWGLAFLAGVASSGLVFVLSYLTYCWVEQEEEDA